MKLMATMLQSFLGKLYYIGFRFGLIKRRPRIQHYVFAHKLLPQMFFENPTGVVMALMSTFTDRSKPDGVEFLRALWDDANVEGTQPGIEWDPSGYLVTCVAHPNNTVIVISLPAPLYKAEAFFAAMVFDAPGMATGHIRQLRYFVLEHLAMRGEHRKTCLSEWLPKDTGELGYRFHFEDVQPSISALLSKIEGLLPAKLPV